MEVSQINLEIKNFPNICRICINSGEFKPLLGTSILISYKVCIDTLKTITGIEVSEATIVRNTKSAFFFFRLETMINYQKIYATLV